MNNQFKPKHAQIQESVSLADALEYAENIINAVREPLIVLDQNLRVVTVSRSFYDFFKVNPEETMGQLIYDLGNKQWDIPKLRELLETILPEKATFDNYEVEHDFDIIGRRTMLLNARRIPRPPEKPKVILLAIEDITRRRRKDDSDLTLAAIVNTSTDGIIGKDIEGYIISWNKAAENIYSYTENEMLGKNISLLAPPGYKKEMISQFKKLQAGELIKNYETKCVRKDGVVIDISLTLSPIKDKLGNICGVSAIMHDITEQKKVKQLSEYSESIINTVREPLIVLDQNLRVVTVGRSFYDFFKVNPEETVGQLIYDLGNKQWDIPKLRELLEDILPKKVSFDNYEVEHNFSTIGRRIMLLNARQIQRASGKERIILLAIEDITERREIEAGLEKTRKELEVIKKSADEASEFAESVINTVREPLISLDQDLRVVTVSRSFYDFFKVNPEETMGQLIYDLGNKQWDIPKLRELLETILPEKATFDNYEVEHDFDIIGRRTMLLNARRIPRPPEKPKVILLAIEDITRRRRKDDSDLTLAAIVNTSTDGIIGKDIEGYIISWNKAAENIYSYTENEMLGKNISLLAPPGYKKEMISQFKKLQAGELIKNYETKCVRKDGVVIDISLTLSPIKDKLGNICGVSAIMHDITEQKKVKQLSEYSESIINTVREPLIVLDQNLRVVTVGRSFYDFFKVNPEETVGQLIYDLGNKQWDIPKLRELLEDILPKKVSFDNYEVEHNFSTIGRRIMLLNARQIQRALGKERIILLAIEDITERREIENGLEKAHEELKDLATELKRTALVKSEFLANMSHELRTPLNSINGFSEVLYDETFGPLNEKQKKYVNNVLTSGKHLLLLINQILDMAKVEAGKMNLVLSSLPMKSLLNEISLLVADMVSKKKIEMLLEIAEDLPNIEADELKVKEIMYNLISNAVKFTPESGKIGMRAKKADSEIEIMVWDTGVGIAPENMKKIFEGFFRVDTPYSRVTEGTGLGLPLSKKLVELHGGKLTVESEGLNKGTSIKFTLPIISRGGGVR